MGIDLHLLTKGAASNKVTDERRHTRPPVVPGKEGVSTKETTMTGGVTVRGRGLIFSVVHLPPITSDSPFTFTVLIVFFADAFQYVVW